jgi:hypothetical protein
MISENVSRSQLMLLKFSDSHFKEGNIKAIYMKNAHSIENILLNNHILF